MDCFNNMLHFRLCHFHSKTLYLTLIGKIKYYEGGNLKFNVTYANLYLLENFDNLELSLFVVIENYNEKHSLLGPLIGRVDLQQIDNFQIELLFATFKYQYYCKTTKLPPSTLLKTSKLIFTAI